MKKIALAFLFLSVTVVGAETPGTLDARQIPAEKLSANSATARKLCTPLTLGPCAVEVAQLNSAPLTRPADAAGPPAVLNSSRSGPRYDVTDAAFGARGDAATDDTSAVQAAFDACWHGGVVPYGGIVEFPGHHGYLVSSTINIYDGCQMEGANSTHNQGGRPPQFLWNGPATGAVYAISGFTTAANAAPYLYAPSSPAPFHQFSTVTFTAANSMKAGQWVDIEGLSSTVGLTLNRVIAQVASGTSSSFTIALPFSLTTGTFSDSGRATLISVVFASDANARYNESISNVTVSLKSNSNPYQVGFYFGSRVDTGTRVTNTWVSGASMYGYYFSAGGINVEFDKGWRSDAVGISGIYWRITSSDSLGIANGTVDNHRGMPPETSGGAVMLDNAACVANANIHFTSRNFKVELNSALTTGLGAFTLYDCPSNSNGEQFFLDFESTWVTPGSRSTTASFPSLVMSPANDKALNLSVLNSQFPSGAPGNSTTRWVGLPELSRHDILGDSGMIPILTYAPSLNSEGEGPASSKSPIQLIGDVNIDQLWQYGIPASDFLYSDTAFAALPNATTLFAGQILAPPAYWNGAKGKRYAIQVVYQSGTTGTPNGGRTLCTGGIRTSILTCTSEIDLSAGQKITIGTDNYKMIRSVDATQPGAVLVNLSSNLGATYSSQPLSFSAPLLAPELQLSTKSSAPPTSLLWAQGDMEQNSGAVVGGVAGWVNVGAGSPGSWAGIPLGDTNGKIAASQLMSARTAQAFCAGTSSSSNTLLLFGAGSSQIACTQSPGPQTMQQVILTTGGVLSNLAVRCGRLGSQPSSGTFTVWDLPSGAAMANASSGTNTGLTVTIGSSAANANRTIMDTRHTFAYEAGDMIRIQFTTQANETLGDCTASFNY